MTASSLNAVPGGKRVCAAFDSPALSMTWLAEEYPRSERSGEKVHEIVVSKVAIAQR